MQYQLFQATGANICCKVINVRLSVAPWTAPSRLTNRDLSKVRIWSNKMRPDFPLKVIGIRKAAERDPVVMGATMTVRKWFNISGGEIKTQGLVFWISLPTVGSSWTNQISPVANSAGVTTSNPCHRHCQILATPKSRLCLGQCVDCPRPSPRGGWF